MQKLINPTEEAIPEKDTRLLILGLQKQQKELENAFYRHLAMQEYKTLTTVALKVLALTSRLQLYCPLITHKSLLSLYQKISSTWKGIMQSKTKNQQDSFRCEFFAKLIIEYAECLQLKS